MRLSTDERSIFEVACGDRGNASAQELLNVFAVTTASAVLAQVLAAPKGLHESLAQHIRQAIDEQKQRKRPF
jgi:hypothetical protein